MTISEACALVVDLVRDLAEARGECEAYRLVALQAVHRLHDLDCELARLRESHKRVIEEYRAYRAATVHMPGRAA